MNKQIIATKFFNLGSFLEDEVLPELLKKFRQHHHHIVRLYIAKLVTLFDRGATWLNPNYAEAYYKLGLLFQKQQKWLEAATAFEEATKSGYLKLADAYCNLGKILFILGEFEESLRALQKAIKLEPEKS
ncbi:MAG: tetratricopeptide repeat protein [Microcoleaceae cyanobacterium MO_207.B10]|nr:tetratricopeptide repeat protein [Microcoleaceae cyanobacterium MO_207.B10]